MSAKVECPICNRSVPEANINLHLDLQCPGAPGGSSPPASAAAGSSVQKRLSTSQDDSEVEALDQTPVPRKPARSRPLAAAGPSAGPSSAPDREPSVKREANEYLSNSGAEKRRRANALVANQPLAERSRPSSLATYIGQEDIVGPGSLLRSRIEKGEGVGSCILWGPPGSGKTTLARLIAKTANADFKELSATSAGTADVRQVFEQAKNGLLLTGRKTIMMVDEIHRFNRPQQDLFLPYVENGWVQLIGATTENPSFKVNGALLSRCQVFVLSAHSPEHLESILRNALKSLPGPVPRLPPQLLPFLADVADGDARQALNGLELALKVCETPEFRQTTLDAVVKSEPSNGAMKSEPSSSADPDDDDDAALRDRLDEQLKRDEQLMEAVRRGLRKGYDRTGEERYDMISALHKCLRASDGSASMYWLARTSEDIGLADPHALPLAMATYQACQVIGLPECRINLAHCVAYLAEAPKSTRSYEAYKRAESLATAPPLPPVPLQVRNAPTRLMKKLGYGKHYSYNPDFAHPVWNETLPPPLAERSSMDPKAPMRHILRTPEHEASDKTWDEERLKEWEHHANGGKPWKGRAVRREKMMAGEWVPRAAHQNAEEQYSRGTEQQPAREQGRG
ncbi:DNA-dependent ATPase mgs1 [Vanrija albida]|uniref:DNA-dependent ATPase mgs1 n=1 Tax=Vanrija albida TaxID=181172 RepID=A0ABR3Q1S5_9TREE